MQTARGLAAGVDFDALGRVAVNALQRLASGRAAYDGGRFALSGAGPARDLVGELPGAIQRDLPSGVALGAVAIQPIPASPYLFAARRGGGRVTLTGYTPDPAVRDAMRGALERLVPTETVVDDLHLADGAPDGFAVAAGYALEAVAQLAEGSAELVDRRLVLQGRALYPGLAKLAERRVGTALPPGWTGLADIKADPIERPLEASLCADLLADNVRRDPPRFEPGKAEISARSNLDALRDVVRRCGPARIRVTVRAEPGEESEAARTLSAQRAAALAAALGRGNTARLAADGTELGAKPRPEQASPKPGTERVAFVVEP
jgi:OOP family OmpA-OmpF porin